MNENGAVSTELDNYKMGGEAAKMSNSMMLCKIWFDYVRVTADDRDCKS